MTISNWLTIIVPIIALVGGALLYSVQKRLDRELEIHRERRDLYRRYMDAYKCAEIALRTENKLADAFNVFQPLVRVHGELMISAPDQVVDASKNSIPNLAAIAYAMFLEQHDEEATKQARISEAVETAEKDLAKTADAMRRDSFGTTEIDVPNLLRITARSIAEMF